MEAGTSTLRQQDAPGGTRDGPSFELASMQSFRDHQVCKSGCTSRHCCGHPRSRHPCSCLINNLEPRLREAEAPSTHPLRGRGAGRISKGEEAPPQVMGTRPRGHGSEGEGPPSCGAWHSGARCGGQLGHQVQEGRNLLAGTKREGEMKPVILPGSQIPSSVPGEPGNGFATPPPAPRPAAASGQSLAARLPCWGAQRMGSRAPPTTRA